MCPAALALVGGEPPVSDKEMNLPNAHLYRRDKQDSLLAAVILVLRMTVGAIGFADYTTPSWAMSPLRQAQAVEHRRGNRA